MTRDHRKLLSLAAIADLQQQRQRLDENWQQRLERARYQAERAESQYQAVEPENRLVARTLEQRWESALQELRDLEEDYSRFRQQQPANELKRLRKLRDTSHGWWDPPLAAELTTPRLRSQS